MEKNYNLSFFKPSSEFSRKNRNLVLVLVSIWAIAVFGFQILLKIIEKPIPEKALTEFNSVKEKVFNNQSSTIDKQIFLKSLINVVNKNTLNKETEKPIISKAINWGFYSLISDKNAVSDKLYEIDEKKEQISEINNLNDYRKANLLIIQEGKNFIANLFNEININKEDIRSEILISVLTPDNTIKLNNSDYEIISNIMNKYMIHNRSVLTDTRFIGFPFHYFYTAVFLLILFVGLCFTYAWKIERLNKQFGIIE